MAKAFPENRPQPLDPQIQFIIEPLSPSLRLSVLLRLLFPLGGLRRR